MSSPPYGGVTKGAGSYASGEFALVSAHPADTHTFHGWQLADSPILADSEINFVVTQNLEIEALFRPKEYFLEVLSNGSGIVSGEGTYLHGDIVNIEAYPSEGYRFVRWTGFEIDNPFSAQTKTILKNNKSIVATFEKISHVLEILPSKGGKADGASLYEHNEYAEIQAYPETGFYFLEWYGEEVADKNSSSSRILMNKDKFLKPIFVNYENFFTPVGGKF